MDRLTDCRLLLKGRDYTILGVSVVRTPQGTTLVLHTAGGADPMLVLGADVDRETVIAVLQDDTSAGPGARAGGGRTLVQCG